VREVSNRDDTLTVFFMCCHPALTPASAIALTLRAVGGLSTAEIANAFLVGETTMAQRISRAKQSIQASGVPFQMPTPDEQATRLRTVLHVLYLIFNEGYTSSTGRELQRTELSDEAIRLTRLVHRLLPDDSEVTGLLALMLLIDARRPARTDGAGELIPLAEQDRTLWDQALIAEGIALTDRAVTGRTGRRVQAPGRDRSGPRSHEARRRHRLAADPRPLRLARADHRQPGRHDQPGRSRPQWPTVRQRDWPCSTPSTSDWPATTASTPCARTCWRWPATRTVRSSTTAQRPPRTTSLPEQHYLAKQAARLKTEAEVARR
jgi:hypothetical protein